MKRNINAVVEEFTESEYGNGNKMHKRNTRINTPLETVTPNKFDVIKKRRSGNLTSFSDSDNRTYGMLSDLHYLYRGWIDSGEVNEVTTFAMWVILPKAERRSENPIVDFPPVGDELKLTEVDTNKVIGIYQVRMYPEKITRKSRSTSVILARVM